MAKLKTRDDLVKKVQAILPLLQLHDPELTYEDAFENVRILAYHTPDLIHWMLTDATDLEAAQMYIREMG